MARAVIDKDKENVILLSLSREIALVRDKNDLSTVLHRHLKTLFPFTTADIGIFDKDSGDQRMLFPETPDRYPFHDGIFDVTLAAGQALLFDVATIIAGGQTPEYLRKTQQAGIKEFITVALRSGGEKIGVLYLLAEKKDVFTQSHLDLLEDIAPQLSTVVANILIQEQLQKKEQEKSILLTIGRDMTGDGQDFREFIGEAPAIHDVFRLVSTVADSRSTVLILGETGTGKELIARAIHNGSRRADKLLVKVNCATLPANLIESELFGHEKGSFTGATERKLGKFELAGNSTIFLDEIGELPLDLQVKLLRVLQEREIDRVGGRSPIPVDVRIIAATNRNIEKEVAEGRFRTDLYYRLNVFPIVVPPLRERKTDIPLLTAYFIERYAKNAGKRITGISEKAQAALMAYDWPGNVRELEHLIERSILLAHGPVLKDILLPDSGRQPQATAIRGKDHFKTLRENEREHIQNALRKTNGKISGPGGAAELLDINVSTLNARIRKLGINKDRTYQRSS
jgi:formate hydrogenlyase transcriptional activator